MLDSRRRSDGRTVHPPLRRRDLASGGCQSPDDCRSIAKDQGTDVPRSLNALPDVHSRRRSDGFTVHPPLRRRDLASGGCQSPDDCRLIAKDQGTDVPRSRNALPDVHSRRRSDGFTVHPPLRRRDLASGGCQSPDDCRSIAKDQGSDVPCSPNALLNPLPSAERRVYGYRHRYALARSWTACHSAAVTGWIERRLPFLSTII
jgi:hypothetical protein